MLTKLLERSSEERKDLYNRLEAKDWATYLQATQALDDAPLQVASYIEEDEYVELQIANILPDYEVTDDDISS